MSQNSAPSPQGKYVLARRHGSLVFTAGMTPRRDGKLIARGKLANAFGLDGHREAVELACANALIAARNALDHGERIVSVLSFTVFIVCEDDFERHSQVADFASDYLHRELGDAGIGCRAAIGVISLPGGASIEIQLTAAIGPVGRS